MSKSREQIQKFLGTIDISKKKVLDAGSGTKSKWAKNWTKGKPKEYVTLDVQEKFKPDLVVDLNRAVGLKGGKNIQKLDKKYFSRFDYVFCIEVLEHTWNPVYAMANLAWFVKQGGKVVITVPFINPIHDEWDFLRFTDEWLQKVGQIFFKKGEILPRYATKGMNELLNFYRAEGLRMSKIRLEKGQADKLKQIGFITILEK